MACISTPVIAAGIGAAGGVAGGLMGLGAADTQAQAAQQASANQMAMYQQTRSDLMPFMAGGGAAFSQLSNLLGLSQPTSALPAYGGMAGSANYGQSGQNLLNVIGQNSQYGASNLQAQIMPLISSGAPLSQIQAVINNWAQHTTSPGNAAGKNAILSAVGNLSAAPAAPVTPVGQTGSTTGNSMLDTLRNYPGYQWAYDQGLTALDRSAAAKGLLLSGGQVKDAQTYGQGMADQLFNQYYNQLMGTSRLGENAAAQSGDTGQTAAANAGQFGISGANAAASGQIGLANSLFGQGGALQNALTAYQLTQQPTAAQTAVDNFDPGYLNPTASGGFAYSDRRLKTDVRRIGHTDSGLPVYTFRYKGSRLPQMGIMAQDVEKVAPELVGRRAGFRTVNYGGLSRLPPLKVAA